MKTRRWFSPFAMVLMIAFAGHDAAAQSITKIKAKLSGDQEVPPVATLGSGTAVFLLHGNGTVSGMLVTEHIDGVAAHIHQAPPGKNGPVVIPLTKTEDHKWRPAKGARLTAEQVQALSKGELYVNVHTKDHPGGEIRGQLGR